MLINNMNYALQYTLNRRIFAFLINTIIYLLYSNYLVVPIIVYSEPPTFMLILILMPFLPFLANGIFKKSIGYLITGLEIVHESGDKVNFKSYICRSFWLVPLVYTITLIDLVYLEDSLQWLTALEKNKNTYQLFVLCYVGLLFPVHFIYLVKNNGLSFADKQFNLRVIRKSR